MASQLSANAIKILKKRYLLKDENGLIVETPDEMFRRVARAISNGNAEDEEEFYNLMSNLDFLPNSPTLMNAGTGNNGTLSACFVVPIADSMLDGVDSIMNSAKVWAAVQKFGGGVGASFSSLRQKGGQIKTTHGVACGPISVIKHYSSITDMITQGGKRHGANMAMMNVHHPDIVDFIRCKNEDKEIRNFNISVAITDAFMEAVKKDEEYELIDPSTNKVVKKIKATFVFDLIVKQAHKNGEPGIVFIDKINKFNPVPGVGKIEATNPCGEQPLQPYESCNLGSINLANMIDNSGGESEINWEKLKRVVESAVKFLDNVIDINSYPIKQIEEMTKGNRKIGMGVMGFADMLVMLGIPYDSNDAVRVAEDVMRFINEKSVGASARLAEERGAFPNFDKSIWRKKTKFKKGVRNATTTTIAPTGTIGLIADVSQGVEPLFRVAQKRRTGDILNPEEVKEGKAPKYMTFVMVNHVFEKALKRAGLFNDEIMEKVYQCDSLQEVKELPDDIKKVFRTAFDVTPEWHIKIQSAFQKYTHNAVSKTVNLPAAAVESDVYKAYWLAYDSECKGITVYRDGSRSEQVINKVSDSTVSTVEDRKDVGKRMGLNRAYGYREKVETGCGDLYVHLYEDDKGLCEVFTHKGRAGGCTTCLMDALSRTLSISLRYGVPPAQLVKQLRGNQCPKPGGVIGKRILSCPDGVGSVIREYLEEKGVLKKLDVDELIEFNEEHSKNLSDIDAIVKTDVRECPECGSTLITKYKCPLCEVCGWTECS